MVKIDRGKFADMVKKNDSIIKTVKNQLSENRDALQNFIDDSEFTGSTADNVKNYLQDSPNIMLEGFVGALEELSDKINATLSSFSRLDPAEDAIIGESRLNTLIEEIETIRNPFIFELQVIQSALSDAKEAGFSRSLDIDVFIYNCRVLGTNFAQTRDAITNWDNQHQGDMVTIDKMVEYIEAMVVGSKGNRVNDPAAMLSYDRDGELGDFFNLTKYRLRDPDYDLNTEAVEGMPKAIFETEFEDILQRGLLGFADGSVPNDIAPGGLYTSYKFAKEADLNTKQASDAVKGVRHPGAANTLSGTLRFAGNSVPYLSSGYTAWKDYKQDGNGTKALARGVTDFAGGSVVSGLTYKAVTAGTAVGGPVVGVASGAVVLVVGTLVTSWLDSKYDSPEAKLFFEKQERHK